MWLCRIEPDEPEQRDGEDQEHQHEESQGAASRTEVGGGDQIDARDEDREVLDLDREEHHPDSERFGRCHRVYRLHPPGRLRVGIGSIEEASEAQDNEQGADRCPDETINRRGGASRIGRLGEESEPCDTIAAQTTKYPSPTAVTLGRGLREPKKGMLRRSKGGAIAPPRAKTMS
jgi:hypothetical protein